MEHAALFVALLLVSYAFVSVPTQAPEIHVVATLDFFASIAEKIGGAYVSVDYIVPSGTDIHSYSLTPQDVEKISGADLVILAGSDFFSLDSQILENAQGKAVLDFEDYNATLLPLGDMERNPHGYWLYPDNAIGIAGAIEHTLSEMHPEARSYFRNNLESFVGEVHHIISLSLDMVENSGVKGERVLLAVPGVFYIAHALSLNVAGVLVEGPNKFPSQSDMDRFQEEIRSGEISFILNARNLEGSKAGQIAIEISRMTGVKVVYVDIFSADNYTSLLLRDAAAISSVQSVTNYASQNCDASFYVYIIVALSALLAVVSYVAYRYRREILE